MKKNTIKVLAAALVLSISIVSHPAFTVSGAPKAIQESDDYYHALSYEDELIEAEQVLDLGDISNRTTNLVLAHSYGLHVNIHWESSDEAVIDLQGKVTLPMNADKDVTLTATLTSTKTDTTKTKTFTVHVPKSTTSEILEQEAIEVQEYVDYILNTGYTLPDAKELGIRSEISWEIVSGEAEIKDNKIIKTENSAERQPLELKITLTLGGETKEVILKNITLLDEYVGYILSYFAGKEESKEMYLGYSYDGIHWMRLNNADAVLTPTMGDEEIRDPFIMRKKDGSFAILCTDGWNGNELTIWDSENLVRFENERLCVMKEERGLSANNPSGYHTWAPECNYDPITDTYYIFWSDPYGNDKLGNQIYYNSSSDLLTFSAPNIFFEREFDIIDASIHKYKGDYYMVYDDKTGDNEETTTGRRIYVAKADSLKPGTFYPYSGCISEQVCEGPFLLQDFRTESFMAYYDYYQKHKFGLTTIEDITTDDWVYEGISETMPWDEVRHGGAIAVTQKEMDAILTKWALEEPEIIAVNETESVTAYTNDKIENLKLPKKISVTLADGNIVDVPVNWNTEKLSLKETGSVEITGTLSKSNYTAKADLEAKLKIQIQEKEGTHPAIIVTAILLIVALFAAATIIWHKKSKKWHNQKY